MFLVGLLSRYETLSYIHKVLSPISDLSDGLAASTDTSKYVLTYIFACRLFSFSVIVLFCLPGGCICCCNFASHCA